MCDVPSERNSSRNTYLVFLQSEIVNEDRISNEKLFDLYKLSIDTDRFELELGWKLVQFFTVLDSGLHSLVPINYRRNIMLHQFL